MYPLSDYSLGKQGKHRSNSSSKPTIRVHRREGNQPDALSWTLTLLGIGRRVDAVLRSPNTQGRALFAARLGLGEPTLFLDALFSWCHHFPKVEKKTVK